MSIDLAVVAAPAAGAVEVAEAGALEAALGPTLGQWSAWFSSDPFVKDCLDFSERGNPKRKKTLIIVFITGLGLAATKDATIPVQGPEGTHEKGNHSLAGPALDPTSQSLAHGPRSPAPVQLSASPAQRAPQL